MEHIDNGNPWCDSCDAGTAKKSTAGVLAWSCRGPRLCVQPAGLRVLFPDLSKVAP